MFSCGCHNYMCISIYYELHIIRGLFHKYTILEKLYQHILYIKLYLYMGEFHLTKTKDFISKYWIKSKIRKPNKITKQYGRLLLHKRRKSSIHSLYPNCLEIYNQNFHSSYGAMPANPSSEISKYNISRRIILLCRPDQTLFKKK